VRQEEEDAVSRKPSIAVVAVLFLASCSPAPSASPGSTSSSGQTGAPTTAAPARTDLNVGIATDPQSLDPMVDSSGTTQLLLHNIFDTLVIADDSLKQAGDLATSWTFVAPSSWDFTLRSGVTFQNGDPVSADDVKFSFDRILDPANNSAMASFLSDVKSVDVVDPQTVRVTTANASAILPEITKNVMIVPKKVVESVGAEAFGKAPVGSGPYSFVEWTPNDHLALKANAAYWAGAPSIAAVTFKPIPEPSTRVAALETGQVDLIMGFAPSFYDELKSKSELTVINVPEARTAEIILDTNPADNFKPFQDVRVRQAVNEAIDYDSLITQVMGGLAQRNCNPVPPVFFGYNASIQCPTFQPDHAKQLLKDAGYEGGFDVKFGGLSGTEPNDKEVEEAITAMLGNVGIRVTLETPEFGTWLDNYHKRVWPMVFHTNGDVVLDAEQIFGLFYYSTGRGYYTSPEMDKLVDASRTEFDSAKRLPLVQAVLKKATDEYLWVSLFNLPDLWAMNSALKFQPRGDEWLVMNRASW
jgi:peptide/nickel transport system substrate-binding protein